MDRKSMRVVILSRSAREGLTLAWGLGQDSKIIEQVLRECHAGSHTRIESIDHIDPITFYGSGRKPRTVDVAIHLEVPCRAAMRWARYNIVMVNPEWWPKGGWDWSLAAVTQGGVDMFVFKSHHARRLFPEIEDKRCKVVTWRCSPEIAGALAHLEKESPPLREFLYLIGASANKLLAAIPICKAWRKSWPTLHIIGTTAILEKLRGAVTDLGERGIVLKEPYSTDSARIKAQSDYAYHVVASGAEGFGFTFAEAAAVGALPLWTDLPVYNEHWHTIVGDIGKITAPTTGAATAEKFRDAIEPGWSESAIVTAVESLLRLDYEDERRLRGKLRHAYTVRVKEFRHAWRALLAGVNTKLRSVPMVSLPPRLPAIADLPHVAVITLTRNRPRWWGNMARNILLSDYPPDKITWIIADDSDGTGRIDSEVAKFQSIHPRFNVKYLSFPKQLHIGAKRNRACAAAPAEASVFVMMDDDDHYPKSSIVARITWLRGLGVECVYCSVLPMYDCAKYISAINVPPLDLAPEERVSEATLCFTRKFWTDRNFPGPVSVAEGEGFLVGRVHETAEIPPEGIIVSFLHGGNATSRRVPESSEPNGCHYGFDDEYFSYISGLGLSTKTTT